MGGVAGAFEVMGLKMRVYQDFVAGVGFEGVAVALLAAGNPWASSPARCSSRL